MLEAIATVATEPVAEAVARQILRDEHLHAAFGWATLELLLDDDGDGDDAATSAPAVRAQLQRTLGDHLRGFERACCGAVTLAAVQDTVVVIEPTRAPAQNLGVLTAAQYAAIFYATLEREVVPRLVAHGLDPLRAWRESRAEP
jgi:hypothetical protein